MSCGQKLIRIIKAWIKQIARNVTMDEWGFLEACTS